MAMIKCPDCGQEISDKAKKCVNCGKIMIEDIVPKKFCTECGKEIDFEAEECPFCGCPIEKEKAVNIAITQVTEKVTKSKKQLSIIGAAVAILLAVVLMFNFIGSSLNEEEQLAYQNASKLKTMMKDPDSFKLYDYMMVINKLDEEGKKEYSYTIFKYGGANGYGAITTDEAIFKDGTYIMDYADEPDKDDDNYMEQLQAKAEIALCMLGAEAYEVVEVDVEKIKDKMGLE